MHKVCVVLLVGFLCAVSGLTACGTSCTDACVRMAECGLAWGGGVPCVDACENLSDCNTKCDLAMECPTLEACLIQACLEVW